MTIPTAWVALIIDGETVTFLDRSPAHASEHVYPGSTYTPVHASTVTAVPAVNKDNRSVNTGTVVSETMTGREMVLQASRELQVVYVTLNAPTVEVVTYGYT